MEVQELLAKYFSGNASQDEKAQVDSWRIESPENEIAFIEYKEGWSYSNVDRFNTASALNKVSALIAEDEKPAGRSIEFPMIWKVAAGLALVLLAGYVIYSNITKTPSNELAEIEETIIFTNVIEGLADGSNVVMSEGASIEYLTDFANAATREIKLTGKAYFDIERDETKPFIIHTENAQVEVLGTSFLVDNDIVETSIIVESGLVSISRKDKKGSVELNPGELGLIKDSSKGIIKRKNTDANYLAWKTGVLYFNNSNLQDVSEMLRDLYDMQVIFENPSLKACKITATFKNRSGDEILDIVGKTFNLEIERNGNTCTIKGDKC